MVFKKNHTVEHGRTPKSIANALKTQNPPPDQGFGVDGESPWESKRRKGVPERFRSLFARAYSGKSKAAGVKAFCLECVCYQSKEVKLCPATACPLWRYRPYQDK